MICRQCAHDKVLLFGCEVLNLESIFDGIGEAKRDSNSKLHCSVCGTTLADIITQGQAGCANCYSHFHSTMIELITEVQGHKHHVGKTVLM